jgi:hypothetical protein
MNRPPDRTVTRHAIRCHRPDGPPRRTSTQTTDDTTKPDRSRDRSGFFYVGGRSLVAPKSGARASYGVKPRYALVVSSHRSRGRRAMDPSVPMAEGVGVAVRPSSHDAAWAGGAPELADYDRRRRPGSADLSAVKVERELLARIGREVGVRWTRGFRWRKAWPSPHNPWRCGLLIRWVHWVTLDYLVGAVIESLFIKNGSTC